MEAFFYMLSQYELNLMLYIMLTVSVNCLCYLGQNKAVVVGIARVTRFVFHCVKEEHRHDLGCTAT